MKDFSICRDKTNTSYSWFNKASMHKYNFSQMEDPEGHRKLILKVFGRNIRNLRLRKKLTQEQVAEIAGIHPKYLGEVERGEKSPTALVVYKISKAIGASVSEILSDKGHPTMSDDLLKEVERLFEGKEKKDIQKALRILEVFFE